MIVLRIPATSANIGPGFDCMGFALQIYNIIQVEETSSGLDISYSDNAGDYLPTDEKNLVYRSMKEVFDRVGYHPEGLKIHLINNIPVTRGLGSSSACVTGGLFAANILSGNPLTEEELIFMAAEIEGHPDNSTPAILGGMVVAVLDEKKVHYVRVDVKDDLKFAVLIPDFILSTKKARNILPKHILHKDGVYNAGRAALMAASLITGKYDNLLIAAQDKLHQPYREHFIPGMKQLFRAGIEFGAKGIYLSGAGPTLIAMLQKDDRNFESQMAGYLRQHLKEQHLKDWSLKIVSPDNEGIKLINDESVHLE